MAALLAANVMPVVKMTEKPKLQISDIMNVSHNGRELELMLAGVKPMASFTTEDGIPDELVGDAEFAPYVESGQISKHVYRNDEDEYGFEMRSYCLPTEDWRGKLRNLLFQLYWESKFARELSPDDRHRIDSFLLGYSKEDVEKHIEKIRKHSRVKSQ